MNIAAIFDKLFRAKDGRIVIVQAPNAPVIVWGICVIAGWLPLSGGVHTITRGVGFLALLSWAVLEVGWGVNYFRRVLGLIVLIVSIISRLK